MSTLLWRLYGCLPLLDPNLAVTNNYRIIGDVKTNDCERIGYLSEHDVYH
jgi:hypothetical protein